MADNNQNRAGFSEKNSGEMSSANERNLFNDDTNSQNANNCRSLGLPPKSSDLVGDKREIRENDDEDDGDSKTDRSNIPFYKYLTNPLLLLLDDLLEKHNAIIDDIINEYALEGHKKKGLIENIPTLLQGCGRGLKETVEHIENLIQFEKYEPDQECITELIPANLHDIDTTSALAIIGHSLGAYISILESGHLKHLATRIVTDVSTWISRIFRYPDSAAHFHEEEKEGVVKICQLALHKKFPKYSTDGYEALYARPPVIYISSSAKHNLGQHLCHQIGLPLSSLSIVPCNLGHMDLKVLRKLVEDDLSAGRTPAIVVACAGTSLLGRCDDLEELHEISRCHDLWLHLEGSGLSMLPLCSYPPPLNFAPLCNSMTLNLAAWLALPSVPFVTLFRSHDVVTTRLVGLSTFNVRFKLNCMSLWLSMLSLGYNKIIARLQFHTHLAKIIHERLQSIQIENELVLLDLESPSVIFKYQMKQVQPPPADQSNDEKVEVEVQPLKPSFGQRDAYFDTLNIWLTDMLKNTVPQVQHVSAVEVDGVGMCVRYAPLETSVAINSWSLLDITKDDMSQFLDSLEQHIKIVDATVTMRPEFKDIVDDQDNLRLVYLQTWAGLGAVRYIPENLLNDVDNLSEDGKIEVNALNHQIVQHLKSSDSAFSLGISESGLNCIRFGLVTHDTDLEELIAVVLKTGKEVEESSKYLETMANIVKKGIEQAAEDLEKENKEKLLQEGLLRQVPLVGSLLNWWSPPPKDAIKGRSFNLASGKIASTEDTYKSCMQVLEGASPNIVPPSQDVPIKFTLKRSNRKDVKSESGSEFGADSNSTQLENEAAPIEGKNLDGPLLLDSTIPAPPQSDPPEDKKVPDDDDEAAGDVK